MKSIDYWIWKKVIPLKKIKEVNKLLNKNLHTIQRQYFAAKGPEGQQKKFLKTFLITYELIEPYFKEEVSKVMRVNRQNFGFDLYDLDKYDGCCINIYNPNTKDNYDWHIDQALENHIDYKLTFLINISEKPYSGGEFKILNGSEYTTPFNEPGDMIVFKSYLNHKVEPVTKNERRTLAFFFEGPVLK